MKKVRLDEENMWTCDKCHKKVRPYKQTRLWKTSDILFILLKRYYKTKKINKFIKYSTQLNLTDYNINYNSDKKNTYALQSMAIHSGGLGGGHYYAVCKNYLDDSWYEYNDLNVSKISDNKVLNYLPYLFVYKRL